MGDQDVRFAILGPLNALRADRELDLGPVKQRAVLTVLLINANKPVSTSKIIDAVWRDEPPENGANVVQKYVAGLRRVLEPDRSPRTPGQLLVWSDAGYLLHVSPGCLDAEDFRMRVRHASATRAEGKLSDAADELLEALALWRAEPVAGLSGPYFDSVRGRLTEERAAALEAWVEIELELGHHSELVPELVRLIGEFPLREELRHHLILALYRSGRQAEAMAAFREARTYFIEEFGVEPGERLRTLHQRILRSDPALAAPALGDPPAAPTGTARQVPSWAPPHPMHAEVPRPQPPASVPSAPFGPVMAPRVSMPADSPASQWTWLAKTVAILVPLLSCGFFTWTVVCYFAVRLRSRVLAVATGVYLALTITFTVAISLNPDPDTFRTSDDVALLALFIAWVGGIIHTALLTPHLNRLPASANDLAGHIRREQARRLLIEQPQMARDLGIGRPDLPRNFDDGGLVDVNHVPEHILAALPGIGPYHARRIMEERRHRGEFASIEELGFRAGLPARLVETLRDVLIFESDRERSD